MKKVSKDEYNEKGGKPQNLKVPKKTIFDTGKVQWHILWVENYECMITQNEYKWWILMSKASNMNKQSENLQFFWDFQ